MIRLHIGRLVVPDDLPVGDGGLAHLRAGVTAELEVLAGEISHAGSPLSTGRSGMVRGDDLVLVEHDDAMHLGRSIGRCIYGGITRVV